MSGVAVVKSGANSNDEYKYIYIYIYIAHALLYDSLCEKEDASGIVIMQLRTVVEQLVRRCLTCSLLSSEFGFNQYSKFQSSTASNSDNSGELLAVRLFKLTSCFAYVVDRQQPYIYMYMYIKYAQPVHQHQEPDAS